MKDKRQDREEQTLEGVGDGFLPCPTEAKCSPPTPSSRGKSGALQHGYLSHSPPFWRPQNPLYEASHLVAQGIVVPVVRIKSMTVLQNDYGLPSAHGGGHLSTAPKLCATQEAR